MGEKSRARAIISGRVQGVFYRLETKYAAERYGVFGWVKNRSDGTVEAVFEGDMENVNSILDWCRKGPPRANVKYIDVKREDYLGEFIDFQVIY